MDFNKDYYAILGVTADASRETIKAAYRKLAKQYHPDKNPGNAAAEDIFKEINEAHEVLCNETLRNEYDTYQSKQAEKGRDEPIIPDKNKKTRRETKKVKREDRLYVQGKIRVKFWAEPEDDSIYRAQEIHYKITPTDVRVTINETDIHPYTSPPLHYHKAYSESDVFKVPIDQPVRCTIISSDTTFYYFLELQDIRIANPRITDSNKYEQQSLGTLEADIYAYVPEIYEEETEISYTEYFGTTGAAETKSEGVSTFIRYQYYNKDGSAYWGDWILLRKEKPVNNVRVTEKMPVGCAGLAWLLLLVPVIFLFPRFFLFMAVYIGLMLLLALGGNIISLVGRGFSKTLAAIAFTILFILLLTGLFGSSTRSTIRTREHAGYDSLSTTQIPVQKNNRSTGDTLISHFIQWNDYASNHYQVTLSVLRSDVTASVTYHDQLLLPVQSADAFSYIYRSLTTHDSNRLQLVYNAFDSIRTKHLLDKNGFAAMIVSCIQSLPYYLVVDKACNSKLYQDDEYISGYLANCTTGCCVGNVKYGVRAPLELLSDLKGDCDTRALLLYTLLKHYHYNVAILTSNYYQHALIAVDLDGSLPGTVSIGIRDHNYYLWETTNKGFEPGKIPPALANLNYWHISLLNQN